MGIVSLAEGLGVAPLDLLEGDPFLDDVAASAEKSGDPSVLISFFVRIAKKEGPGFRLTRN